MARKSVSATKDDNSSTMAPNESKPIRDQSIRKSAIYILVLAIVFGCIRWGLLNFSKSTGDNDSDPTIDETLKSMLSIESRVSINKKLNVAVGFGSCLDIFVSSKDLVKNANYAPATPEHHQHIRTQEELEEVLAYFFVEGAAAERYIDNRTLFRELVDKAKLVDGSREAIGGNAAVMANRFILEGLDRVVLGTQHSKLSTELYNNKLVVSGPLVDHDDVHICIEYPAGERWGEHIAPRANRLIIHSDYFNPTLKSIDNFLARLESNKNLDLIVIGGLQMMDNLPVPTEARREKLMKLSTALSRLPSNKPKIHLELASFTEEALLDDIRDYVVPHVHSMGMNEQELPNILNYLSNNGINIRAEAYPRVATTLDQMRQLYQLLQKPTGGKLTRIHTHTLAFQAIMTRVGSEWKNTLTSSVKAALTAHRYTCGSHQIDMGQAKLIMDESYTTSKQGSRRRIPFNPKHPVVCWQEDLLVEGADLASSKNEQTLKTHSIEICVAPVLVCTKVKQTGGAGDNVSAAGLIFQL